MPRKRTVRLATRYAAICQVRHAKMPPGSLLWMYWTIFSSFLLFGFSVCFFDCGRSPFSNVLRKCVSFSHFHLCLWLSSTICQIARIVQDRGLS